MALLGMFNVHHHGAINSAAILLYALTCCISGYVSSHFYRQIGGERWVWNIILTTSLFSGENCPFPGGPSWEFKHIMEPRIESELGFKGMKIRKTNNKNAIQNIRMHFFCIVKN